MYMFAGKRNRVSDFQRSLLSNQIKSNLFIQKQQLATNNAKIKTV